MKKRFREITVDGEKYGWCVNSVNCDGDGGKMLKIFRNKKLIYEDLFGGDLVITPKGVADAIKILNEE
jgi:hypothetical protein